jgi:ABC-type branched-subunit amino acid transport system ATPase component
MRTSAEPTLSDDDDGQASASPLRLDKLTAGYANAPVIRDVSLSLVAGEVRCVVGPNGAGKSTLIKAICGDARVFSGTVLLDGLDVTSSDGGQIARRGLGWVPQIQDVFPTLSVRENLEMGGYLLSHSMRRERIDEVVGLFPLLGRLMHTHASKLSGGERKLVALGRAMILKPRVLLLDEPTAGLSPEYSTTVLHTYVRGVVQQGVAVLMVEQRVTAALQVAEWAYVMIGGRVSVSAPASELLNDPDIGQLFLGSGVENRAGAPGSGIEGTRLPTP